MPTLPSHRSLSLVVSQDHREASDAELARGLMAGDTWALDESWRRFAPMVLLLAKKALGSQSEADDVGQEVFCRLFRKARSIKDPDSLRAFIYSIAVRALHTELHRKKLRAWFFLEQPQVLAGRGWRTMDVESRDLVRKFHALLERLSARERLAFVLRRMESMTVEEIAAAMGISESSVKRSIARASSRLSQWIDADPGLADAFDTERWGR